MLLLLLLNHSVGMRVDSDCFRACMRLLWTVVPCVINIGTLTPIQQPLQRALLVYAVLQIGFALMLMNEDPEMKRVEHANYALHACVLAASQARRCFDWQRHVTSISVSCALVGDHVKFSCAASCPLSGGPV